MPSGAPTTVNEPGLEELCVPAPGAAYVYDPLPRVRTFVVVVELTEVWPVTFTNHFVPVTRPDSVKVTANFPAENVTDFATVPPVTLKVPTAAVDGIVVEELSPVRSE
jgi:hypothetical protein